MVVQPPAVSLAGPAVSASSRRGRITDEVPIDEEARDAALQTFQTHYHPGARGSVSETALEQGDDELDADEEGQDPGRED